MKVIIETELLTPRLKELLSLFLEFAVDIKGLIQLEMSEDDNNRPKKK